MNIVFLTTEGPPSFFIINEINRAYPIKKVFFRESPESALTSRFKKIFRLQKIRGHIRHYLEKYFFRRERELKSDYEHRHFPAALDEGIGVERVASLNAAETIEMIRSENPDIILVQGTEILKDDVLAIAKREIINLHPAILPRYKGGGLPYWSFYNRDFDQLGVTVHVCTNNLDAGPILGQAFYKLTPDDKIYQFSHRMNTLFVELTKNILASYTSGQVHYQQQTPSSKVWTKKDLTITKQLLARKYFKDHVKSLSG